jgi:hypothetical protein
MGDSVPLMHSPRRREPLLSRYRKSPASWKSAQEGSNTASCSIAESAQIRDTRVSHFIQFSSRADLVPAMWLYARQKVPKSTSADNQVRTHECPLSCLHVAQRPCSPVSLDLASGVVALEPSHRSCCAPHVRPSAS